MNNKINEKEIKEKISEACKSLGITCNEIQEKNQIVLSITFQKGHIVNCIFPFEKPFFIIQTHVLLPESLITTIKTLDRQVIANILMVLQIQIRLNCRFDLDVLHLQQDQTPPYSFIIGKTLFIEDFSLTYFIEQARLLDYVTMFCVNNIIILSREFGKGMESTIPNHLNTTMYS
jgi:hypothetical protein